MEEGKLFFLLLPLYLLSTKVLKKCQGIAQIMSGHFMEKTPLVTRYLYLREKHTKYSPWCLMMMLQ